MKRLWALIAVAGVVLSTSGCEREKDRLDSEVRRLCKLDGGIKVYEQVNLRAEMLDNLGSIQIPSKERARVSDEYFYEREVQFLRKGNPELLRSHHQLIRRADGKLLGESIRYTRRGGDMPGPWIESSFSCPEIGSQPSLEQLVFQRK